MAELEIGKQWFRDNIAPYLRHIELTIPPVVAGGGAHANHFLKGDGTWSALPVSDLSVTPSPTGVAIEITTGDNTNIPLANATNAGLLNPARFTTLNYITATGSVNLDDLNATMVSATAASDGTSGRIPAPLTGQQDHYLKGDGSWATLTTLVGTNGVVNGAAGVAPIPLVADANKFLKGDGLWTDVPTFNIDALPVCP